MKGKWKKFRVLDIIDFGNFNVVRWSGFLKLWFFIFREVLYSWLFIVDVKELIIRFIGS